MIKQYVIIKWYPSLYDYFKVGDIIETTEENKQYYRKNGGDKVIPKNQVENNPEFFKEHRDYDILALEYKFVIYDTNDGKGNYWNMDLNKCVSLDYGLADINIHSIQRIWDHKVFTVGDIIDFGNYRYKEITGFTPVKSKLKVSTCPDIDSMYYHGKGPGINIVKHSDYYLRTLDGVFKNKKDQVFNVMVKGDWSIRSCECEGNKNGVLFNDIKNAKNYVLYNKPCLSLNNVLEWGVSKDIKSLVKRKLNIK